MWERIQNHWLWLSAAALCLWLLLTATMQYRWINRVSEADHQQRRALLETTLRNLQGEFDRELRDATQAFRRALGVAPDTDWEPQLNAACAQWLRETERPRLIAAVSFALTQRGATVFKRRALDENSFTPRAWPAALTPYRAMLEQRLRAPGGDLPLTPRDLAQEFSDGRPLLAFQLVEDPRRQAELAAAPELADAPGRPAPQRNAMELLTTLRPAPAGASLRGPELMGWCFLELDAAYLQTQWLPNLIGRSFGQRALGDMEGYDVAVLTGAPPRALYQNNQSKRANTVAAFNTADAALVLFARRIQNQQEGPPRPRPPRPPRAGPPVNDRLPPAEFQAFDAAVDPQAWRLVVRNAAGSLETAIRQARWRNLALGFSVLLILAASFVLLMLAMQRVRRLAAQQLEFVAGVSHELRTPLAVIQSASHNLAQGMVRDPSRVQQYGAAIQTEARRLSHQLEQMLAYAGIQSGRSFYDLRPVKLADVGARALADYAAALTADGWQVEWDVSADLPLVLADAQALESVIKNLLHNAQKYAAAGRWLGVSATQHGDKIQLVIADCGPGIAAADLPHLFEPFYRGQRVLASTVPGAGLGLSLVQRYLQAMGGRVTVKSGAGAGTAFTLHLPIASETVP